MYKQQKTMMQEAGLIYTAAYDPEAWFMVGDHTIYWPAHTIHDRPSLFEKKGLVKCTLRNGAPITVKPATHGVQIILCGLLLVLQLVAGGDYQSDLLTEHHNCDLSVDFGYICKKVKRKIPTVEAAFDQVEAEFARPSGARVEQLLKSVFFPLLKKAYEVTAQKDPADQMKVIEF